MPHLERASCPRPAPRRKEDRGSPPPRPTRSVGLEESLGDQTEHFEIQTNVPLAEAIAFGRQLEAFHELFFALMADVIGRAASRWPSGSARPDARPREASRRSRTRSTTSPTKEEYVEYLGARSGRGHRGEPGLSTCPPGAGKGNRRPGLLLPRPRRPARRDRDALPRGLAPAPLRVGRAQRLHEERGQLLGLRRAGDLLRDASRPSPTARSGSAGWSARGSRRPGSPFAGRRVHPARAASSPRPERGSTGRRRIYLHYAEAMALTVFLMQAATAALPRGRSSTTSGRLPGAGSAATGRSLEDRLGSRYRRSRRSSSTSSTGGDVEAEKPRAGRRGRSPAQDSPLGCASRVPASHRAGASTHSPT